MYPLNKTLKLKLLLLSLVLPLSFFFIGFIMSIYLYNLTIAIVIGLVGIGVGILLNFVCYYRKLFTAALYQTPIPAALFLLIWWISNSFASDLYAFFLGLGGLAIGLWLNSELVSPFQFYKIRKRFLALLYFFFSIALMGFFMGIPAFNILLGVLAGNYLSIRIISNFREERDINKNMKQGATFTSVVLLIIILISALMALSDIENSLLLAQEILRIPMTKNFFLVLIILGGIVLVLVQYYLTLFTAKTMLQLWKHKRFSRYSKF